MTHSLDLDTLTLAAVVAALDDGRTTSVDVVTAVLERAGLTEGTFHAYAALDPELALSQAAEADRRRAAGEHLPLGGVPIGVKDVIRTRDYPTRAGSNVLDDEPPGDDAEVVARLRRSGAVVVGKLVTHAFAMGQNLPPSRNAWAPTHYPGGSSAGAGVAVALGSALGALGTDSAGSVRKPASLNGVVGFKPSRGRLPTAGVIAMSPALDHVGLFTRTVADCRLLFEALAEGAGSEPPRSARRRLGLPRGYFESQLDPAVGAVVASAETRLGESDDFELVEFDLPLGEEAVAAGFMLMAGEGAAVHQRWLRERADRYDPATRAFILAGSLLPAPMLAAAYSARRSFAVQMAAVLEERALDGLLVPTLPLTSLDYADMVNDRDLPRYIRYTVVANLTGQPAITVPAGLSAAGLPVGISVLGRPGADEETLAIAAQVESALGSVFRTPQEVTHA